jgi:hypothetical protein
VPGGLWDFAMGYAYLKQGDAKKGARLSRESAEARRNVESGVPDAHAKQLLGIAAGILDGEMKRMAGDVQGSIEPFTRAVDSRSR